MFHRRRSVKRFGQLSLWTTVQALESRALLSAIPVGPESRVNAATNGEQSDPDVAMAPSGDYVITWTSNQSGNFDVYAQRYAGWGGKIGTEFRVNATTTGDQFNPAVAMDQFGNFLIVWQDSQNTGDIFMRRYDASGTTQGADLLVNTVTSLTQSVPKVAMDSVGNAVIVWKSTITQGTDDDIIGQRVLPSGAFLGGNFRVNVTTTGLQQAPDVAMGDNGLFTVSWTSPDDNLTGIFARRFAFSGGPLASEFRVNTTTFDSQNRSTLAADPQGNFVITWDSSVQDGSAQGIFAQRYNASGVPQGSEFQVNTTTFDSQVFPTVGMTRDGNFLISYYSFDPVLSYEICAQLYLADGTPFGTEFHVNTYTPSAQLYPRVAFDAAGDFLVTWQSYNQDADNYGIYAQLYANKSDYVGVKRSTSFYLDSNHSDNYDTFGTNNDSLFAMGNPGDLPLIGDWNGDGFDDIGVWRAGGFYLDANGNGAWNGTVTDRYGVYGLATDTPLVGDWNGDGIDDIGVWRAGVFYLDANHNRTLDALDVSFAFGAATDTPIIGDWNGDGRDDVGVWRAGLFYMDLNGNRKWDRSPVDRVSSFGLETDTPIVGDWNGDGRDDLGVKRAARFWIDGNANGRWDGAVDDYFIDFGNASGDVPLVGFWRPKVVPGSPPNAPAGLVISAAASEVVSSPTVTSSQMDSRVTKKGEVSTVKDVGKVVVGNGHRHAGGSVRKRG